MSLILCGLYERTSLFKLWGYKGVEAINKGIVIPKNLKLIILFITENSSSYSYENSLKDNVLNIQGEKTHYSDNKIRDAEANGDSVLLFYRKKSGEFFMYYGEVKLEKFKLNEDKPSEFTFTLDEYMEYKNISQNSLQLEQITHGEINEDFIPDEEGRKLIKQHITYERSLKNRIKAIKIHGTSCKVCGFDFNKIYGKELADSYIEIHHINSLAQNEGIVNPNNDLIPLCSNCHSMIHKNRKNPLKPEELKELIKYQRQKFLDDLNKAYAVSQKAEEDTLLDSVLNDGLDNNNNNNNI